MKIRALLVALLVIVAAGVTVARLSSSPTQTVPDFKISAIRAHLYYESTGKMSRDVIGKPTFALWNVCIGAGDAEAPTSTTMVVVEMTCPKEQINVPEKRRLVVRVTQGKKVIENKSMEFPFINDSGKIFMPIFIYGFNTEPLKITATITGQQKASTMTRVIEFHAGE